MLGFNPCDIGWIASAFSTAVSTCLAATTASPCALFEFELQQRTDREIEVKHRGTGHVYRFLISEDGSSLQNEHTIVPNPSSAIDAAMFSTPARRAALRYISER
jgi:hypothetical protein